MIRIAVVLAAVSMLATSAMAMDPAKTMDTSLGKVWTDQNGMTLYIFDQDKQGATMSACVDKCIQNWPPFVAGDGAMAEGDWTLVDVKDKDGTMKKMWAYDGCRSTSSSRTPSRATSPATASAGSGTPPRPSNRQGQETGRRARRSDCPVSRRERPCLDTGALRALSLAAMDAKSPPIPGDLLERFAAIVGESYALRDEAAIAPYLIEPRERFFGRTPLVLRPATVEEVSAILRLAGDTATPVVPQGGNTGLVGAQVPDRSGGEVVVSLSRLSRIREIDPEGDTMTVEAGVILAEAQRAADAADRLFPLSLASEGSCQIGGNLSTNAGGTAVLAYGNARELVLGIEVVLASGEVWNGLRKLRKDNTGYDLRDLFVGAEGTLGVITAAVLKLFPKPRGQSVALVGVRDPGAALRLFAIARAHAAGSLTAFELMPRIGIEMVMKHLPGTRDPIAGAHPWYVLFEISSSRSQSDADLMVEAIFGEGVARDAVEDGVQAQLAGAGRRLLADSSCAFRRAEAGRRFDQARRRGAGRGRARADRAGRRSGDRADPRMPPVPLRPSRRRQHPLQCQPASRRRTRRPSLPAGRR